MWTESRLVGISMTVALGLATLALSAGTNAGGPSTPSSRDVADRLLDHAVAAFGGAEYLDQLRSIRVDGPLDLFDSEGGMQRSASTTLVVGTECMRQERRLDDGTHIVRIFAGSKSYLFDDGQALEVPAAQHEMLRAAFLHRRSVLLRLRHEAAVRYLGATQVDGHTVGLVEATLRGVATTLGVDTQSGVIRLLSHAMRSVEGIEGDLTVLFRDFHGIDGVLMPQQCEATFEGRSFFASAGPMRTTFDTHDTSACQPTLTLPAS